MTEEETNELTPEEEQSLDTDEIDKAHQKVKEQLSKTKDRLEGKPANDLETFREHRKNLADAAKELAALIRKQDKDDHAVKELGELSCQLGDHRFLVGAFGTTAAGKSTLVNALVGGKEDLLTEGMGRTTLVVTRIEKPDKKHPDGTSVLRYKTNEEVAQQLEEHLGDLGIDPEEIPESRRLEDPAFRSWLNGQIEDATSNKEEGDADNLELAEREAVNSLKHFLSGWDECEQFLGDSRPFPAGKREQTDALIHKPKDEHACYVKERILYHANRLTGDHGIELVDAPGVSADAADTQRAVNMARKADAFVFVSSVGFQFMQADRRFLEDLDDSLHGDRKKKLIFVLNKTQTIDPYQCVPPVETAEEAIKAQEDRFRNTLAEHGFKDVHVLSVDAQCGKYARRLALPGGESDEALNQRFDRARFPGRSEEENLKLSGIDKFESDLVNILLDLKYNHDVSEQVHKIEKIEADYRADLGKSIETYKAGVDKIQEELEKHRKSRKIAEMTLKGYQSTWKERTDSIHAGKEDQCNDILNDYFEKVLEDIMNGLSKRKGSKTKTVVKEGIRGKLDWLVTQVKQARQGYEKEYRKIRDKTFREDLKDVLEQYGDDELPEINIDHQEEGERESIRYCAQSIIRLTNGEIFWAWAKGGAWDFVTFNLKEQKAFKGMIRDCLNKRRSSFIKRMNEVMTGWIECDWHNFEEQTTNHFDHLMDNIGSRIKNRINAKKRWKGRENRRKKALERFHQASGEILEQLKEVRKAAEKRRPFEGAGA
jgi:predicted GTPase